MPYDVEIIEMNLSGSKKHRATFGVQIGNKRYGGLHIYHGDDEMPYTTMV